MAESTGSLLPLLEITRPVFLFVHGSNGLIARAGFFRGLFAAADAESQPRLNILGAECFANPMWALQQPAF